MDKTDVIALHTFAGQAAAFGPMTGAFAEAGLTVHSFNLPGFGETTHGSRGDIGSVFEYIRQVSVYRRELCAAKTCGKFVLLGEGLGGLIAALYAAERPEELDGLILSNPLCDSRLGMPFLKRFLLGLTEQFLPGQLFDLPFPPADLCDDPADAARIEANPAETRKVTARFWWAIVKGVLELKAEAHRIKAPTLLQVSSDDRYSPASEATKLHRRLGSTRKELTLYPGRHILSLSHERGKVFAERIAFVKKIAGK